MHSIRDRFRSAARSLCIVAFLVAPVHAQAPELPAQWFPNRTPRDAGQAIPICVDGREPGHLVDGEIALAIADALLVEAQIVEVERAVVVENDFDMLYVDLVDRCTAYVGFKLYAEAYPEWLTFTRPFYEARFVLLGREDGPRRLEDLSPGAPVGVVQGTLGDIRFLTFNNARSTDTRLRRIPLGTPENALHALIEGRVVALVIWEPWVWWLARSDERLTSLRSLDAPVVSEPWIGVGATLPADRTFARTELDRALAALTSDGTIGAILQRWNYPARPVQVR